MKKIFTHLLAVLMLSLLTTSAWAQVESGKVYRFINKTGTNIAMMATTADGEVSLTEVYGKTKVDDSSADGYLSQLWLVQSVDVEGESYYQLRNLETGRYLVGNTKSQAWSMTNLDKLDKTKFELYSNSDGYVSFRSIIHKEGDIADYCYMHYGTQNEYKIVGWLTSGDATLWTAENVDMATADIETALNNALTKYPTGATYENALSQIFEDYYGACLTLKSAYQSMNDDALAEDTYYASLPEPLQKMVKKVRDSNWEEKTVDPDSRPNGNNNTNHSLWTVSDTWESDYAKKFRVQMYEPYSIEGEITTFLRINGHCNMDNPTGIYANAGDYIYIMVDGEIPEGAELWVAHQVGHGATYYYNNAAYTQLQKGLNVVEYTNDGSQLWINYVVHTYNSETGTFPNKLSDFAPLKIHIEGGYINGFFNTMGDYRSTEVSGNTNGGENLWGEVDNDLDWDYCKARAALSGDFALLGHRQTLLFDFGTYDADKDHFCVANADNGLEWALAYWLEVLRSNEYHYTEKVDNVDVEKTKPCVPEHPNCYGGTGNTFGTYAEQYPNMGLDYEDGKINIMLEAWDRIQYSEHASLGLLSKSDIARMNELYPRWTSDNEPAEIYNYGDATVNGVTQSYLEFCEGRDYSEYYNHHGAAVGAGSGYMSGGWRVCNYHYNTMGSIIGLIANEAGPTWGPAHEIGHQHQAIFNLNGQTEVTNNFHSNVAVWYMGMGTSRYNGSQGALSSVLDAYNTDNNDLYTNNIWAITHLYYRLWLYYHLAGNNTQFWPRLFELCRQVPIVNGGQISGETSLLRFYQHACNAAGEDLTEFFRAHGYFELMTDRLVGDYSNGTYNVTEEQIETAITAIENKNYPKNYAILLINDGTEDTTVMHDGTTKRSLWDGNATAEYGSVTDFIEDSTSVTTAYEATVSADGTVTMSGGEGGVGFLIFNEEGELVSFSNSSTFEISDEAAYLLATGKATISAVDAKNNTTEAEVDLSAIQREMLKALIDKVKAMPIDDGSYTHVGFYTNASAADLLAVLTSAETAYESNSGCGAAYEMLYTAKENFVNSQNHSFVPFDSSLTYVITNCAYADRVMHLSSGLSSATGVDKTATTSRWQFKEVADTVGVYNIYSTSDKYLTAASKSTKVGSSSLQTDAAEYTLMQESPVGTWSISLSPAAEFTTLHDDSYGKVVGWEAGVNPSKWYLTAVENNNVTESMKAADELQALIAKTEALVDVVGLAMPCALQTTDATEPFYLYCNANVTSGGDASLPANGYNILDGKDSTFLHTVYSGNSQDGLHHYLLLDLGKGNTLSTIQFYYKTRHNGNSGSHPQVIKVEGSNDKETFDEITTISSGLPNGFSEEYTSDELTNGKEYRYFRFMVTDTYGTATDDYSHEYFYIAEFSIPNLPGVYTKVDAAYQEYITNADMATIYNAIVTAKAELAAGTDLVTAKSNLKSAYDTFYGLYIEPINDKKDELEQLALATDAVIESVGTITFGEETPVTLTTSNLYCNAEITTDGQGVAGLLDDDESTFLHTNNSNPGVDDGNNHYLRVDLGEGVTTECFMFSYQNRAVSTWKVFPKVLKIEGSNDENSNYETIVELSDGLPEAVGGTYESQVLGNGNAYRYFRFVVTSTYAANSTPPYFCMAKFRFTAVKEIEVDFETAYQDIVTEELLLSTYNTSGDSHTMAAEGSYATLAQLEAQITKLTEAKRELEAAMNNVDKSKLETSLAMLNTLYGEMANNDGGVNDNYQPSALTAETLAAAKTAIDDAQAVIDDAGATQLEVNTAKATVDEKYNELLTVKEANVNLLDTFDKSALETLITNTNTLLNGMNDAEYYATATGIGLDELKAALAEAQDAVSRYYLTQDQYTAAYNALNSCYTTTSDIVALDVASRETLTALITDIEGLLSTIAESGDARDIALPLQATNNVGNYYISALATGDGSVANLLDKNADGTGNTGTYYGSVWNPAPEAFSQYLQVDLGEGITIDELLFDYTTRDGTQTTERPNAIRISGSNDGVDFAEITTIESGLATGSAEQWTMQTPLALGRSYRYIRFTVNSERHSFHMSDFNLYAEVSHTLKDYYTTAQGLDFVTLCMALQSAQYAADHYLTSDQLTAAVNALNGYYTTANDIVADDVDDRTGLTNLIVSTQDLVNEIATVNEEDAVITLQSTEASNNNYIWSNAPHSNEFSVANLLDTDATTYFHSAWDAEIAPEENHYLAIDLGEGNAIGAFAFSYTTVADEWSKSPTSIRVQGANILDDFTTIAELTSSADGLPNSASSVDYESKTLNTNGEYYRYLRFVVTANRQNGGVEVNGTKYAYFQLATFGLSSKGTSFTIKEEYRSSNISVEAVSEAVNETAEATDITGNYYVSQSDYQAALDELQAAYDALNVEKNLCALPVILTTDVNNPVLYKIKVKSNSNVFTYEGKESTSSKKPVLAADELGNRYQAWYFMQGENGESYEDVLIMPYYNEGEKNTTSMLGYASINEGIEPVASETGASGYNWYITFTSEGSSVTTEGWWNLQPEGGDADGVYAFINQYGGPSATKLAIWRNANNPSSDGSQFQFVLDETDYSLSDAYYALLNQYNAYGEIEGGTAIGTYTVASADAYMEKYGAAGALVEAKNSTDEEYDAAREAMVAAYDALLVNMPDPDKLYVLRCNHENRYIYVNADNKLQWEASSYDKTQSRAVWLFEDIDESGTCKMKSLHTQSYLNELVNDQWTFSEETGKVVTIVKSPAVDGAVIFKIEGHGDEGLHAHGVGNTVIAHTNTAGANHYFFEEVTDVATLHNDVTIKTSFSSVMLGYNATMPADLEAYTATGIKDGYVTLLKVAGPAEVLPANTPVILYRPDLAELTTANFVFNYTSGNATVETEVQEAIDSETVCGRLFTEYVECDDSYKYYKLMIKTGEDAKMYHMYEEFDANGTYGTKNIYKGTHDGGHIKCSANKIYMKLPAAQQAASYGLRFKEPGTTAVDEMTNNRVQSTDIYDLQGRKLTEITQPGMYIVNGKKVYVK